MPNNYDVIIVGAGPAGVAAALSCANRNLSVLLLDSKKKENIGDKVCGEAISKRTVLKVSEYLKVDPPNGSEVNADVYTMVIRTDDPGINISMPAIGYMVDRHKYGQRLLSDALSRGVKLIAEARVLKPIIKDNKVSGVEVKVQGEKTQEFRAKIVIDASGSRAVIRTNLPEDFAPELYKDLTRDDYASCFREIIELKEHHDLDGKIVLQYEKDIPEPGYIWFFGDGKNKLNCGTGFRKTGRNQHKSVKEVYFNALKKYYPTYQPLDSRGAIVPVQPPIWNAVAPGLLIAGDAAFHADPLTAEGHGPALLAGMIAGDVAAKAIEKEKYDTADLWEYNVRVMKEFGNENTLYKVLASVLEKMGSDNLKFLLRKKVIQASDLTSEGLGKKELLYSLLVRIFRCMPKIGLLFYLKKAISASRKIKQLCDEFPTDPDGYSAWKKTVLLVYSKVS